MIVEKGHFHFTEKYWWGQAPPAPPPPPCSDGLEQKQGIQLCYGGCYTPSNTLILQYFGDFNKCLQAIFSQLSLKNFWLYLLAEVVMNQNC